MFSKKILLSAVFVLCSPTLSATQWQLLPETPSTPANNPSSAAKIELGKMLYFDPRFSSTGTVSCNSCHNVMEGGDDSRPVSAGVHGKVGGRNAPTVWNSAYHSVQFWDGRVNTLEDQAKGPVTNPVEMDMSDLAAAMARVKAIKGYQTYFEQAFEGKDPVTKDNAAKAVAAFERTLVTPDSPYSRFVKGDKSALTAQQQRGMQRFSKTGCTSCHSGGAFNGPAMPLGKGFFVKFPTFADNAYVDKYQLAADGGRFENSKNVADKHMWRVPTLLNIALSAPYFHNGSVTSLQEAVRVMAKTQLNKDLSKQDVADISAFLEGLTGTFPEISLPRLPSVIGSSLQYEK